MKLCKRCANQIVESTKLRIIPDAKPFGLVFEPQVVVPESECEFWAHMMLNEIAAMLQHEAELKFERSEALQEMVDKFRQASA